MFIDTVDKKVNIKVSDLVSVACRMRERFRKFDSALKDDPAFAESMVERELKKNGDDYFRDVNLSCSLKLGDVSVELSGKTSVIHNKDGYTVNVVRSMRYPVRLANESFVADWLNEAKILAFILARKHSQESVSVLISVFHTETLEKKECSYTFKLSELESFFKSAVTEFSRYLNTVYPHVVSRNQKSESARFPFPTQRDGQSNISKEVYSSIKNKNNIIVNAPTGLGKTVATLYPALRAQGRGLCEKVFYLTAKSSGSNSVIDAVKAFEEAGFDITVSVISAKYKICEKRPCSPQNCRYPDGHHGRTVAAVFDITSKYKVFDEAIVKEYSRKYDICPFMLEMELTWFADLVVCDYNYVFDPKVSAKISACLSGNDAVLVDEAHNLIDRLRNVYSATVDLAKVKELYDKTTAPKLSSAIKSFLDFIKRDGEDAGYACEQLSSQSLDGLEREINALFTELQEEFEDKKDCVQEVSAISDSIKSFIDLLTLRSDDYLTFYNDKGDPEIFMVNTGRTIFEKSKQLGNLVLFSATLFPEEYYRYMLGAKDGDSYISYPSPFDNRNFLVLGYPLSTRYSEREQTVEDVVRAIWSAGRINSGNYIAFFPSYQYMLLALNAFIRMFPDEKVIYQKPSMTDSDKQQFIASFENAPQSSMYAFAVLGGTFSEGIDLVGDKLSGAVVVGLGSLPPSRRSALISEYFTDMFFDGDKFAYHYPGLNKVFQAGGRVIRSESDKGFLLIIDDRFLTEENLELLPENWSNVKKAKDNNAVTANICDFWQS